VVQWRRRNASGGTDAVLACGTHAITLDAAAHVHAVTCAAPDPAKVPACNCTPEPIPATQPSMPATQTLPTGWTIPVVKPPTPAAALVAAVPQAPPTA
jgi:hypothetical protein